MTTKLVWITPDAQHMICKCARVSNPTNQENRRTEEKLMKYLANHKHWSPFEMASMCVEITTTRAISAQILRHRSFHFQEMSQRYSSALKYSLPHFRVQDKVNRQNSLDTIPEDKQKELQEKAKELIETSFKLYNEMLENDVAKESARFILPLCTETTMYMTGTIRDWIHYIQVRGNVDTQLEHREIALAIKNILLQEIPSLSEVLTDF